MAVPTLHVYLKQFVSAANERTQEVVRRATPSSFQRCRSESCTGAGESRSRSRTGELPVDGVARRTTS